MRTRIQKWGNSLAVRIPKTFAAEVGLKLDSAVEVSLVEGELRIAPLTEEVFTLEELVDQITDENRHPEADWGPSVGSEAW